MTDSRNLFENADFAEGESQSVTDFLEIDCNKCGNKIKFKLAIGDIKNVEEYIEQLEKTIQTKQEEIERLKKTELKTKGGGVKVTLEGLICLETKILDLETELNKKDTLIKTMQAEFERLENLEDNTDMLKEELKKKDKYIKELEERLNDRNMEKC